jgi:hypothetical protein
VRGSIDREVARRPGLVKERKKGEGASSSTGRRVGRARGGAAADLKYAVTPSSETYGDGTSQDDGRRRNGCVRHKSARNAAARKFMCSRTNEVTK